MIEPIYITKPSVSPEVEPEVDPLVSEANVLVLRIEHAIKTKVLKLLNEPFTERVKHQIDYLVKETLMDFEAQGLYPLPHQYLTPVVFTLQLDFGIDVYKKDYVLRSQFLSVSELKEKMQQTLCDVKFKSMRQLDYEARHGIKEDKPWA